MADQVVATKEPGWTKSRTVIRVVLLAAAFALQWAGNRQHTQMNLSRSVTYAASYGTWFGWMGLVALAGFTFSLACWLPRKLQYRWGIALLLGLIPLVMSIHLSMFEGPTSLAHFAGTHFNSIVRLYFFDTQPFVPVLLLGAAVAAGFSAV